MQAPCEPNLAGRSLFCSAETGCGLQEGGLSGSKKGRNGELLAEIPVVSLEDSFVADNFLSERRRFSVSLLIVCNKKVV